MRPHSRRADSYGSRFHRHSGWMLLAAAFTATACLGPAWGYSTGPLNGYCGDPPNGQNCTACHSSFQVNSGSGALAVSGLPTAWLPGTTYPLTVTLSQEGQQRWGFELTAIRETNGQKAGSLSPVDPTRVQLSEDAPSGRDYLKHTSAGTYPGQQHGASWDVLWVAPEVGAGAAHFYIAGNASNNSGDFFGDYIYTTNYAIPEGGACCALNGGGCTVVPEGSCDGIWTAGEACSPEVCSSPAESGSWGRVKALYRAAR